MTSSSQFHRWAVFFLSCASTILQAGPLPDISSVPADLQVPEISNGPPAAGKRVSLGLFKGTPPVVLYLPDDWATGKKFPMLIELAGNGNFKNSHGDTRSGLPEGSKLGYGLSGGKGFICACLPFLNEAGDFTFLETGFRNHNDAWLLRPSAARDTARAWLAKVTVTPSVR